MPQLNPNDEPMSVDDLLELERAMNGVPGFGKVSQALSFQQEFFGLFGTAVLMRQGKGTFVPIACTNIPNCAPDDLGGEQKEEQEFDTGSGYEPEDEEEDFWGSAEETGEDEDEDAEPENGAGEQDGEEFHALAKSIVERLAPCFQHEKQPRFFATFNELSEFVSPDLAARFQGYKLAILPLRKPRTKAVVGLIVCYAHDDSQYLNAEDLDGLERIWLCYANSMKLLAR
jgi:hypothetical protein